jgi:hypothetical protein
MEPGRQYFTKSCQTITTCATITDINILSVFTITITDRIHLSVFTVMPPSRTDYLSVITIENTEGFILSIIFTRRKKKLSRVAVCKTVGVSSVVVFFISDRIRDGTGNYRRLVYWWIDSISETVSDNFTDGCHGLHWRNSSVGKTV